MVYIFTLISSLSWCTKFCNFTKSNLYFIFLTFALVITSRNRQADAMKLFKFFFFFCLTFLSKSLLFLGLVCESLIHFELLFVKYVRVRSIILHVTVQFLKHHLLRKKKRPSFLPWMLLTPFKTSLPYMQGFTSGISIPLVFMSFLYASITPFWLL